MYSQITIERVIATHQLIDSKYSIQHQYHCEECHTKPLCDSPASMEIVTEYCKFLLHILSLSLKVHFCHNGGYANTRTCFAMQRPTRADHGRFT